MSNFPVEKKIHYWSCFPSLFTAWIRGIARVDDKVIGVKMTVMSPQTIEWWIVSHELREHGATSVRQFYRRQIWSKCSAKASLWQKSKLVIEKRWSSDSPHFPSCSKQWTIAQCLLNASVLISTPLQLLCDCFLIFHFKCSSRNRPK